MEIKGIDENNILDIVKILCEKTNAIIPIWRNTTFSFFKEKLELAYICESCLPNKSLENESSEIQMTLI